MTNERSAHVNTILGFMSAAQTVLAVYGSPDGPTDPLACHNILAEILEDPVLLRAQQALAYPGKIILSLEQNGESAIMPAGGGKPAFLSEDLGHVRTTTTGQ